jgi:hypothetical protein
MVVEVGMVEVGDGGGGSVAPPGPVGWQTERGLTCAAPAAAVVVGGGGGERARESKLALGPRPRPPLCVAWPLWRILAPVGAALSLTAWRSPPPRPTADSSAPPAPCPCPCPLCRATCHHTRPRGRRRRGSSGRCPRRRWSRATFWRETCWSRRALRPWLAICDAQERERERGGTGGGGGRCAGCGTWLLMAAGDGLGCSATDWPAVLL